MRVCRGWRKWKNAVGCNVRFLEAHELSRGMYFHCVLYNNLEDNGCITGQI